MPTTTNYGWTTPADTDLVKDGAAAIRTLGSSIDTTVFNNANAAIAKTIVDAKGDIIAATAADTVSRLAVGANDTVLMADSSTATGLKWGTVSSGGMTLITTTTFNNTASTYTYSSLGSYKHLMIVIDNATRASASSIDNLVMQFNGVTTGSPYNSFGFGNNAGNGYGTISGNAGNYIYYGYRMIQNNSVSAGDRGMFTGWIYDYGGSTVKTYTGVGSANGSTGWFSYVTSGNWNSTAAITSITLFTESGVNFNTGTLKLYGVS